MSTEQDTPAPTPTPSASESNSESDNTRRRGNNNNNRRQDRNQVQLSNPKNYEGNIPEIGAILALKYEKLDKKAQFQTFIEKALNYAISNYKDGGDIAPLLQDLVDPLPEFERKRKPKSLTDEQKKDTVNLDIYKERVKIYVSREMNLTRNIEKMYGVLWGQCSSALQAKIKGSTAYSVESRDLNTLWLAKELKKATAGIDTKTDPRTSIIDSLNTLIRMKQGASEPNDNYLERFKAAVSTVELSHGDHIFCSKDIMDKAGTDPTSEEIKQEKNRFKAMLLLRNSDDRRYGGLSNRLKEGAALGRNEYPRTMEDMYELMTTQCPDQGSSTRGNNNNNRNSVHLLQVGIMLTQTGEGEAIDPNWILLDTCSTDSVFRNKSFLDNVKNCKKDDVLNIISSGGMVSYDTTGTFKLFNMPVYYNPNTLANVISFKQLARMDGVRITTDTAVEKAMFVHINGNKYKFKECKDGLYYIDMKNLDSNKNNTPINFYSESSHSSSSNPISLLNVIETTNHNKTLYSKQEIRRAEQARHLQQLMGWPGTEAFKRIVRHNLIQNNDITVEDIERAQHIYGTPIALLQGRTTAPSQIQFQYTTSIPDEVKAKHLKTKLYIDLCYINSIPFLVTRSENINFITVNMLSDRKSTTLIKHVKNIQKLYTNRSFIITDIFADGEFDYDHYKIEFLPSTLHICATEEHVPKIERAIRTIKERSRSFCHSLPYRALPKLMVDALAKTSVQWINAFPSKGGISDTYSPTNIFEGKPNPDAKRKRIPFGAYAQVYTGTNNSMDPRTTPAIALTESNQLDGMYFMSLTNGERFQSKKWVQLPIDDNIIELVEDMAFEQGQPDMPDKTVIFTWEPDLYTNKPDDTDEGTTDESTRNDEPIDLGFIDPRPENIVSDEDDFSGEEENLDAASNPAEDVAEDEVNDTPNAAMIDEHDDLDSERDESATTKDDPIEEEGVPVDDRSAHSSEWSFNLDNVLGEDQNDSSTHLDDRDANTDDNEAPALETIAANRPRRENAGTGVDRLEMEFGGKEYKSTQSHHYLMRKVKHVVLTQMSAYKGFKIDKERSLAAMFKELKQLNDGPMKGKRVIAPIDPNKLTDAQKKRALESIHLINFKRNGIVKGRTCANGKKQRQYVRVEDILSSPTSSLESIIYTLVRDAYERRYVVTLDIPGAYLHALWPEDTEVVMKLEGKFVDILCDVDKEYKQYVTYEKGKKVLYVRVLRALYGCLESALLWYELYSSTLEGMGFKLNPYDLCVANKIINGKQCTITFYVDDNKISHEDPEVVRSIVRKLEEHFGKVKVIEGPSFDFLGMDINLRKDGKVEISMKKQVDEAIDWFGEEITESPKTPANKNLFNIVENAEELDKKNQIHSIL